MINENVQPDIYQMTDQLLATGEPDIIKQVRDLEKQGDEDAFFSIIQLWSDLFGEPEEEREESEGVIYSSDESFSWNSSDEWDYIPF